MQSLTHRALALAVLALTAATTVVSAQSLRGSPSSVDLMYTAAHRRDLQFLRTPEDIYAAARAGSLELISITEDLDIERVNYPFVLPNTLRFADSLAARYRAACGERLVVTSGARPLAEQPRNASPKSVHPTGMAVDFRRPQTPACLTWLRKSLVTLEDAGVIEATEERHPPHFHVAVLRQRAEPHIRMAAGDVARTVKSATTKVAQHSRAKRPKKTHAKAVASP